MANWVQLGTRMWTSIAVRRTRTLNESILHDRPTPLNNTVSTFLSTGSTVYTILPPYDPTGGTYAVVACSLKDARYTE